ncbi:hypothetical protein L1049_012018 [Liquidambar formosana]|uniref:VOC domain-containing protein n=1 Tax=Liquidambar formosana TaxID=63359 RepID=A0AAP0X091_LIQFO
MEKQWESNIKAETRSKEEKPTKKRGEEEAEGHTPPLMALNHVSRLCKAVKDSIDFFVEVMGFVLIERPPAFHFDGAWLFNYGIGIHLIQAKDGDHLPDTDRLDPMDNHISFQCEDMEAMEQRLEEYNVKYMKRTVEDKKGTAIDQLFFKDPDGYMIEICNCENLKLVPAGSLGKIKLPLDRHNPPVDLDNGSDAKSK